MNKVRDLLFDCLCRTCMERLVEANNKAQQQWQYIDDTIEDGSALGIAELLSNTIPQIKVQLDDELPRKICSKCVKELLSLNRFQQRCIQSDQHMRDLIAERNTHLQMITETTHALDEKTAKELTVHQFPPEIKEQKIDCEAPQSNAADPLLSTDEDSDSDVSEVVKKGPNEYDDVPDVVDTEMNEEIKEKTKVEKKKSVRSALINDLKHHKKQYSCGFCNKTFKSAAVLRKHTTREHSKEGFLCPECGKSFNTERYLKQHRLRHRDEKPYECPHCPLKFSCNGNLSNHKKMHKSTKEHICQICGSAFKQRHRLERHKKYHNGEKPYKCDYCEMCFVRPDHKRRHMRVHTGEKPFKCKYCDRAFSDSGDRTKHLRRSHLGDNVYRCELCPLAFRLASEMRLHFATHKNDDEETRGRNMKALREENAKLAKLSSERLQ